MEKAILLLTCGTEDGFVELLKSPFLLETGETSLVLSNARGQLSDPSKPDKAADVDGETAMYDVLQVIPDSLETLMSLSCPFFPDVSLLDLEQLSATWELDTALVDEAIFSNKCGERLLLATLARERPSIDLELDSEGVVDLSGMTSITMPFSWPFLFTIVREMLCLFVPSFCCFPKDFSDILCMSKYLLRHASKCLLVIALGLLDTFSLSSDTLRSSACQRKLDSR